MRVLGNHLVLQYTKSGSSHLAIYESDGSGLRYVSLPTIGSIGNLNGSEKATPRTFRLNRSRFRRRCGNCRFPKPSPR